MKKTLLKNLALGLIAATLTLGLSSCSKKDAEDSDVRVVVVGTGNAFSPFCYLDDNGNLVGYEKDVLDAVDELLPQYKFEYETFDFANILIALQAGKVDIGSHQYGKTPQREETYLFGTVPYRAASNRIIVLKDRNDISSVEDLQGKTVNSNTGSLVSEFLERYNSTLPDDKKINIVLTPSTITEEERISKLKNGTYDATFTHNQDDLDKWNREYGNLLKDAGELSKETTVFTYHVFRKDDVELRDAVDGALKQLLEDGTLAKISLNATGYDYTVNLH